MKSVELKKARKRNRYALSYKLKINKKNRIANFYATHKRKIDLTIMGLTLVLWILCFLLDSFRLFAAVTIAVLPLAFLDQLRFYRALIIVKYIRPKYYRHRRELFKQGSLYMHFFTHSGTARKLPKAFDKGKVVIWAETISLQNKRYKILKKKNQTVPHQEFIKL